MNKAITRLDLVEGGKTVRQGHHFTLALTPRDENGNVVVLTGKTINVVIVGKLGIVYETTAVYDAAKSVIRFTVTKNIGYGDMWLEITVTSSTDANYRMKFPTNDSDGKLKIIRGADDMSFVGVQMMTVAQLQQEQESRQQQFEAKVNPKIASVEKTAADLTKRVNDGVGAFTEQTEIIDARGGESNLRVRLDKTTAQLADITVQPYSRNAKNVPGARVTFYFDDGNIKELSHVLPIATTEGIVLNIGVFFKDYLNAARITDPQIKELQNIHGWEIDSHTYNHYGLTELTETEIDDQLRLNKEWLNGLGIPADNIMYPRGYRDKRVTAISRKYHRAGLGSQQAINTQPLDTYDIKRITMDTGDTAIWKQKVDEAILQNGWIVFYGHSGTWDDARFTMFQELIQYVKAKSVPIVTVTQALDVLENKIDVGDSELGNGFKVGSDGSIDASNIAIHYERAFPDLQNRSIVDYRKNKITVMAFNSSSNTNIPFSSGSGTLQTYRLFPLDDTMSYQIFSGFNGDTYKRTWNLALKKWNDWIDQQPVAFVKGVDVNSPRGSFPPLKISYSSFLSADNSGFPVGNGMGVLETNRISPEPILQFQIFRPYNGDFQITRRWTGTTWGEWSGLTRNITSTVAMGEIPANGFKTVVHPLLSVKAGTIIAQPIAHLPDAVRIVSVVAETGQVSFKIQNLLPDAYVLGNRSFRFTQD